MIRKLVSTYVSLKYHEGSESESEDEENEGNDDKVDERLENMLTISAPFTVKHAWITCARESCIQAIKDSTGTKLLTCCGFYVRGDPINLGRTSWLPSRHLTTVAGRISS